MIYVSQIIILYTLNVYSAVCQLYLNKTGRKNEFWQRIETIFFKMEILELKIIIPDTKNSKDRFNSILDKADIELVN